MDTTQNQNDQNGSVTSVPTHTDLPPIPDFSNPNQSDQNDNTSTASSNFFPPSNPNKKPRNKKIVATFLGILLLIVGVAAGIALILQPQLLNQQAQTLTYCPTGVSGYVCNDCNGVPFCNRDTSITCSQWRNLNCGTGQCQNDPHCTCGGCPSGKWCDSGTRSCLNVGGTGNCANNTGDCWVTTGIGVGSDGRVCTGPHWTTCSPGYICSVNGSVHDCVPIATSTPRSTLRPTPTPTPRITPTPTLRPTPTPTPPLACINIGQNIASPRIGDRVSFTCKSSGLTGSPVAYFRWQVNGGSWQEDTTPSAVNLTTQTATRFSLLTINVSGSWTVQCRVCTNSNRTQCTQWGQAN